jgi:hypothetical protein
MQIKTNKKWTEKGRRLPGMKECGCCLRWLVVTVAVAGNPDDSSSKHGGCAVRICYVGRWFFS